MSYLKYLKSLLSHKWYVFVAGLWTGVPIWRLLIHDWSKFTPSEFIPYARYFFGDYPKINDVPHALRFTVVTKFREDIENDFDYAWLHHQKFNPHHWQYWVLKQDTDPTKILPMPEAYIREMVADWMGASKTYTKSWDISAWLFQNGQKMALHPESKQLVDKVLSELGYLLAENSMWSYTPGQTTPK